MKSIYEYLMHSKALTWNYKGSDKNLAFLQFFSLVTATRLVAVNFKWDTSLMKLAIP